MISEETIRKKALGWLTVIEKVLVIGALAWGYVGGVPWVKNKAKRAETVADSTLALINFIQTQLQSQIQQQAQEQTQEQKQNQGQNQSNIQNTEISLSFSFKTDSLKQLLYHEESIETDTAIECGHGMGWSNPTAMLAKKPELEKEADSLSNSLQATVDGKTKIWLIYGYYREIEKMAKDSFDWALKLEKEVILKEPYCTFYDRIRVYRKRPA